LIKVMNLVALLIAPAIVSLTVGDGANKAVRIGISLVALVIVVAAVAVSRSREIGIGVDDDGDSEPASSVEPASVGGILFLCFRRDNPP
jgi:K(+)-stimulated pyrophosphate-energized sodium pump